MYAIAIHERAAAHRDPDPRSVRHQAAVYRAGDGGLAFASEAQALLEAGLVERRVRPAAREELLQLQFTTGADTIFEGIQRVLPGETITCADGHILDRRRISGDPRGGPENIDEDAALVRLDRALKESVDLHQRSDVPYGMFLSGGVDSATLITLMARLNDAAGAGVHRRLRCAGCGGRTGARAAVAKAVGAHTKLIEVTEAMVWDTCRRSSPAWTIQPPITRSSRHGSWRGARIRRSRSC